MTRRSLTLQQVIEARDRAAQGEATKRIAQHLGRPHGVIWNAIHGRTYAWVKDPAPLPVGTPKPAKLYTCANPHCSRQFPPGHGRKCRACTSYYYRHGRHRKPDQIHGPGYIHLPKDTIKRLHHRYRSGESIADLARELGLADETIRRRFRAYGLPCNQTCAGRRQRLTPGLVLQVRRLHHIEGIPINELAQTYGINYQTLYSAIVGATWRHIDGLPSKPEKAMTPCARCGLMSHQPLCRFCRHEAANKGGDHISP